MAHCVWGATGTAGDPCSVWQLIAPSHLLSAQRPEHEQPHGASAGPLPPPALPGGAVSRCFAGLGGEAQVL